MNHYIIELTKYPADHSTPATGQTKNGFLDMETPNRTLELDVDAENRHYIEFRLSGESLSFCSISHATHPAFKWIGTPPGNFITSPSTDPNNRKRMYLNNHHTGDESKGTWHYQIFAEDSEGNIFGIPLTTSNGPGDANPSIKNR